MWKYLILAASVALAGCAATPKTIDELVKLDNEKEFLIDSNYQQVYRNVRKGYEKCYGFEATWGKPFFARSDIYTDINEAHITTYAKGGAGQPKPTVHVKISKTSELSSRVNIFFNKNRHNDEGAEIYRRWANGDMTCP